MQNLFRGVVKILSFASQAAHLGQRGHAHIIVVQPDAVGQGTVARERAVGEAFLFGRDIIDADVNQRPVIAADAGLFRALRKAADIAPQSSSAAGSSRCCKGLA